MTYNTTKMPDHICCPECKDEGKRIMHTSFLYTKEEELGDQWTWHLMNHDNTSKFQWPCTFPTRESARANLNALVGEDLF